MSGLLVLVLFVVIGLPLVVGGAFLVQSAVRKAGRS
jgi:hypothetical protein